MTPPIGDVIRQAALSEQLIQKLKRIGAIRSAEVEAAFRAIPRHVFLPGTPLDEAYRDAVIVTHVENGEPLSSSSQPSMMAVMLEHLRLLTGQRVLEIGAGTGFNAALMSHIVGPEGMLTAVDIDDEVTRQAAANLRAAGCERVQVIAGDGSEGYPPAAPYDRIIVTAGVEDIPLAWWQQLAPCGRIVLPFSVRGGDLVLALDLDGGVLRGGILANTHFISMRGSPRGGTTEVPPGKPGVRIRGGDGVDPSAVEAALRGAYEQQSMEIAVSEAELFDGLLPWLALHDPDFATLIGEGEAAQGGAPMLWGEQGKQHLAAGLIRNDALALLVREGASAASEPLMLSMRWYGADRVIAERLRTHIAGWVAAGRPALDRYRVEVVRAPSPTAEDRRGLHIVRPSTHFTFTLDDRASHDSA